MNVPLPAPLSAVICFRLALASLAAIRLAPPRSSHRDCRREKGAPPPLRKKMCSFEGKERVQVADGA